MNIALASSASQYNTLKNFNRLKSSIEPAQVMNSAGSSHELSYIVRTRNIT